jgi:hypothetical protein
MQVLLGVGERHDSWWKICTATGFSHVLRNQSSHLELQHGTWGRRGAVTRGSTRAGRCFRTLEELSEGLHFAGTREGVELSSRESKQNRITDNWSACELII